MEKQSVRIFIGSSSESVNVARGLKANLEDRFDVRIWNEDLFRPSHFTLDELVGFCSEFDFAVFILAGDDITTSRQMTYPSPRDNTIFEAGLFTSALGGSRVLFCLETDPLAATKLPSDLLGLGVLSYRNPSERSHAAFRAATTTSAGRIADVITERGPRVRTTATVASQPVVYTDFGAARGSMVEACRTAREVKVAANKGLVFFGLDDSIIAPADWATYPDLRRIRIVCLSPESAWISDGMMDFRRYESREVFQQELISAHSIMEGAMTRFCNQLNLRGSGIKYHTRGPLFRLLLTDETSFIWSYAEHPSIQVRDLPVYQFHRQRGSLYGAFRRYFNDLWTNRATPGSHLDKSREPEVSAGGVPLWTDGKNRYIALLLRDDESWVLPKGHKERSETLQMAAIREVSEELGIDAGSIAVVRELDEYSYDETVDSIGERKVSFFHTMHIHGTAMPPLRADSDHIEAKWWRLDAPLPYMKYSYQRTLLAEVASQLFDIDIKFSDSVA